MVESHQLGSQPSHYPGQRETKPPIRVVHFSTEGAQGGAGRAAYSIHKSLLDGGCDSWMVVANQAAADARVVSGYGVRLGGRVRNSIIQRSQTRLLNNLKPRRTFFPDRLGTVDLGWLSLPAAPEILHLHWVSRFLTSRHIWKLWERHRAPLVWTVMDMAPLTGGCHYSYGCAAFEEACGCCPMIDSDQNDDVSHSSVLSKRRWLSSVPITLVGATDWVIDKAARSSLFSDVRAVKIPYGVNDAVFRPVDRAAVRRKLELPAERRIIFFGATDHNDERKGIHLLLEALQRLRERSEAGGQPLMLIAGHGNPELIEKIPFDRIELGYLDEHGLAMAYQAADLFVCPSTEDAGPLMIPESLMCGTPVVAFAECGGAPDHIITGLNGYIAESRNSTDLAHGIDRVLTWTEAGVITQASCRDGVMRECALQVQSARYQELYKELMDENAKRRSQLGV